MGFLKKLFGGGGQANDGGIYFYIRSKRSGEVIQLRLDLNQLTPDYDSGGYVARKTVVGQKSFERLEAEFSFDKNKRLKEKSVSGGEFVTREDWIAQQDNGEN